MQKYEIEYVRYFHSGEPDQSEGSKFVDAFKCPWNFPLAVRRDFFDEGVDAGLHFNVDFFVLYIVRSGRGVYLVDGHPYAVARGDVYILGPGLRHGFRNYQGVELDMLAFQTNLFSNADLAALRNFSGFWKLFLTGASRPKGRRADFRPQRLHLSPKLHAEVEGLIQGIREDICEPDPLSGWLARHRFYCLLGTLAKWHTTAVERRDVASGKAPATWPAVHTAGLGEALQYCEENFHKPLSVAQLAARLFVSPDYFSRMFASETGVPPATYLRRLRLERAQTLLRDTSLTTNEIAARCGFAGREQMVRAFRAVFATTPSEYRQKFRGQTIERRPASSRDESGQRTSG